MIILSFQMKRIINRLRSKCITEPVSPGERSVDSYSPDSLHSMLTEEMDGNEYYYYRPWVIFVRTDTPENRNHIEKMAAEMGIDWIDATGGSLALQDSAYFSSFRIKLLEDRKERGYPIYYLGRIQDPGLGLCLDEELPFLEQPDKRD